MVVQLLTEHPELPEFFDVPKANRSQRSLCLSLLGHRKVIDGLEETAAGQHNEMPSPADRESGALRRTNNLVPTDAAEWALEMNRAIDRLREHLIEALPEALRTARGNPTDVQAWRLSGRPKRSSTALRCFKAL
ncbi:MAG: hypothetical protein ACRD2H_11205 [Terriglobales bacterium]